MFLWRGGTKCRHNAHELQLPPFLLKVTRSLIIVKAYSARQELNTEMAPAGDCGGIHFTIALQVLHYYTRRQSMSFSPPLRGLLSPLFLIPSIRTSVFPRRRYSLSSAEVKYTWYTVRPTGLAGVRFSAERKTNSVLKVPYMARICPLPQKCQHYVCS